MMKVILNDGNVEVWQCFYPSTGQIETVITDQVQCVIDNQDTLWPLSSVFVCLYVSMCWQTDRGQVATEQPCP